MRPATVEERVQRLRRGGTPHAYFLSGSEEGVLRPEIFVLKQAINSAVFHAVNESPSCASPFTEREWDSLMQGMAFDPSKDDCLTDYVLARVVGGALLVAEAYQTLRARHAVPSPPAAGAPVSYFPRASR